MKKQSTANGFEAFGQRIKHAYEHMRQVSASPHSIAIGFAVGTFFLYIAYSVSQYVDCVYCGVLFQDNQPHFVSQFVCDMESLRNHSHEYFWRHFGKDFVDGEAFCL